VINTEDTRGRAERGSRGDGQSAPGPEPRMTGRICRIPVERFLHLMRSLLAVGVALLVAAALTHAESSSPASGAKVEQSAPGSAVSKPGGGAAQRGSEPNAGEVRPGNREGNAPSASAGTLLRGPMKRRILGLPVTAVIVIGGVIVALALAGFAIQRGRRPGRAGQHLRSSLP
jgi:hypothetical protein